MNSKLYDRKAKLPDSLKQHLEDSFKNIDADSNTEGFNRNKELRESGIATYQQIKRIKNWFDSYQGNEEDAPFILNGGKRMHRWCDQVLNHWRDTMEKGKKIKADTGMENQFIDTHDKEGGSVNPHDSHEKSINKFDTAVTEQIKIINKLMSN